MPGKAGPLTALLGWVEKKMPVSRKTHEAIQKITWDRVRFEEKLRDDWRDRAHRAERQLTELGHITDCQDKLTAALDQIKQHGELRLVDGKSRCYQIAMMDPPQLSFYEPGASLGGWDRCFTTETIELKQAIVKFGIGLGSHCPPEVVASQIADQVRRFILQEWRHQSALTQVKR